MCCTGVTRHPSLACTCVHLQWIRVLYRRHKASFTSLHMRSPAVSPRVAHATQGVLHWLAHAFTCSESACCTRDTRRPSLACTCVHLQWIRVLHTRHKASFTGFHIRSFAVNPRVVQATQGVLHWLAHASPAVSPRVAQASQGVLHWLAHAFTCSESPWCTGVTRRPSLACWHIYQLQQLCPATRNDGESCLMPASCWSLANIDVRRCPRQEVIAICSDCLQPLLIHQCFFQPGHTWICITCRNLTPFGSVFYWKMI